MILSLLAVCISPSPWPDWTLTRILGGTSGLVIGDRLSESGKKSVLVIEAGPDPSVVRKHQVPGALGHLQATPLDWNFVTEPQPGLDGRQIPYRRMFSDSRPSARS